MLIFGDTFGSTMVVRGALHTYTFSFVTFTSQVDACNKRAKIARRQGHPCLRFVHDFVSAVFKGLSSCGWRHFSTERTAMRPLRGPNS